MPTNAYTDALSALLALARELTHANVTAAVIQRAPGQVLSLRTEPQIALTQAPVWRWDLPVAPNDSAVGVQLLSRDRWPSQITTGLSFTPAVVAYLDSSVWGQQVAGGLLFLWDAAQAHHATALLDVHAPSAASVLLLRPVLACLFDGRERAEQVVESGAQFHDIINSVPQGIVVVSAQGLQAQVNQTASVLLGIPTGMVAVDVLAQAMRTIRGRCDNAAELEQAYRPLLHALDTEVVVDWQLDDQVWRVDTHPILHDGRNGRVWLFQDVSAQLRLEHVLRRQALRDELTNLFNRRAFFDRAQAHYQAVATTDPPSQLALLLFDIDHFKRVNDRFGHPAGDYVLREVARRAKRQLRDIDLLARYGGEEFIVLLGPTTLANARSTAERLRLAMVAQPVQTDEQAIDVSISVGLTLRRDARETLAQTIERADALLYRAKRSGRNRVVADDD
jgi:diguanylate cyclase (GGDEF)-like protein